MAETRLYLIDVYAQIFRAYYAIRNGLHSPTGEPTHAVFGFTAMLFKLLSQCRPDYVAAPSTPRGRRSGTRSTPSTRAPAGPPRTT